MNIIEYTTYEVDTGRIIQTGFGIPREGPGLSWVEGSYDARYFFMSLQGTMEARPPSPGPFHVWDREALEWVDTRPPGQEQDALYAARNAAELDAAEFLIRTMEAKILTPEEVMQARKGDIPDSLQPFLDALPAEVQVVALVKWAKDARISRMNPLIVMAAVAKGVPDEVVDQIFNVKVPA